jgi:simple sugar transport system permease protein
MDTLAALIAVSLNAGTPLLLAAIGLLINERAGVVNLGAEGIMLVAAVAGFACALHFGGSGAGTALAFGAGALTGAAMAALFGLLAIYLNTNQYATGLAFALLGVGLSAFVGEGFVGQNLAAPAKGVPGLEDLPFVGKAFFSHHWGVYLAMALTALAAWWLFRTRSGLTLRAIGESPESAHALGYKVRAIRLAAVAVGGAFCGMAGAYLSTVYTPMWVEGMVAGRGWIALALTAFATWRPGRVVVGAYLFGAVTMLQFHLQGLGVQVPAQFLSMLPYLACILVLVLISRNPQWIRLNMPASLGKPFTPNA